MTALDLAQTRGVDVLFGLTLLLVVGFAAWLLWAARRPPGPGDGP